MNNRSEKLRELSGKLNAWFGAQDRWKNKKALATDLGIGYSSIKDYFSGRSYPGPDAAQKLYRVTEIPCLAPTNELGLFPQAKTEPPDVADQSFAEIRASDQATEVDTQQGISVEQSSSDKPTQGLLVRKEDVDERTHIAHKTPRIAISGDVTLRRLEVELVDTAEFQRLRSIKQLGTAYLVYPSAMHTRFEHSLGTLFEASAIVRHIRDNQHSLAAQKEIPLEHERLIRLAALLHDVTHVPFGHTLEEETRVISQDHDQDEDRRKRLLDDSPIGKRLVSEIGKDEFELLMKILGTKHEEVEKLGKYAYISDIVKNTVCADLLDYLKRDAYFCNLQESFSDRFLRYFYLDYPPIEGDNAGGPGAYRLIVRLWKKEFWRPRRDVLSELVNLLRLRYALGERVYFHHAKMSSSAMIARAVWSAMHAEEGPRLEHEDLWRIGDDELLARLAESKDPVASKLAEKLRCRALYKRAYTLTRAEADAAPGVNWTQKMVQEFHENPQNRTKVEGQLADLCKLKSGDVLIYCPELDMAKKYALTLVHWKDDYKPLKDIDDQAIEPALKAILKSHELLWGLHVFVTPSANEKTRQTLRDFCSYRFDPLSDPKEKERRHEAVLRTLVNERIGQTGTAGQAEEVVEKLLARHRTPGSGILTSEYIDEVIREVLGR